MQVDDFKKAFDRIPRQKLFDKLRTEGIQGLFSIDFCVLEQ